VLCGKYFGVLLFVAQASASYVDHPEFLARHHDMCNELSTTSAYSGPHVMPSAAQSVMITKSVLGEYSPLSP